MLIEYQVKKVENVLEDYCAIQVRSRPFRIYKMEEFDVSEIPTGEIPSPKSSCKELRFESVFLFSSPIDNEFVCSYPDILYHWEIFLVNRMRRIIVEQLKQKGEKHEVELYKVPSIYEI